MLNKLFINIRLHFETYPKNVNFDYVDIYAPNE